jgi:putative hydrolase of the HAD superfamily
MPVSAVIFDMDDVLCAYDTTRRIAFLADYSGRTPSEIEAALWDPCFLDRADAGLLSAEAYLEEFGRRLGRPIPQAIWVAARRAAMTPWPDMLALAQAIAARLPIALLTNNDCLVGETLDLLFPELRPIFGAHCYVSGGLGLAKPDPAVYRTVCGLLGIVPEQAFFTDDRAENIVGARDAGLMAHVFSSRDGLVTALADAGLIL